MKKIFILILLLNATIYAQTDTLKTTSDSTRVSDSLLRKNPKWHLKAIYSLNGTQSTFKNWNAGGKSNVSLLGFISASAYLNVRNIKWENDLNLALGGLRYYGKANSKEISNSSQKTDDRIDISSKFGLHSSKKFYFSIIAGLRTQSLDGYNYPNDSVIISRFMAPGYVNLAIGYDFVPGDNFGIFLSPFASKFTFVNDQKLADIGSFGVKEAVRNSVGEVIINGKRNRSELGAYFKIKWNTPIAKNIYMKSKLDLFSNYTENPENIDVNGELILTFKVNSWFSSSIQANLIYDDDIDITDNLGNLGPRTQFKSVFGLGISYTMKNVNGGKS